MGDHEERDSRGETLIFGVGDSFHGLSSGVWNLQNGTQKRARKLTPHLSNEIDHRLTAACSASLRVWPG